MSRSRPHGFRLRASSEWLKIVRAIIAGSATAHSAAVATLRREVGAYVEYSATLPVAALDGCDRARRTIAHQVVDCLELDDFHLITEWRRRCARQRDHASFAAVVKTVVLYCTLQYAQSARGGEDR